MCDQNPSQDYRTLEDAFDYMNAELFQGKLPYVVITLQRKANTRGYYRHNGFTAREGGEQVSEIALNPSTFSDRTDEEILSTLAHEQCHLWQYAFGSPASGRYHNAEWAMKMKEIGLQPITESGKETGQKVSHTIMEGGAFATTISGFLGGHALQWQATDGDGEGKTKSGEPKKKSKVKYTCPECKQNAWAKPESNIMCGDCVCPMEAEDEEGEGGDGNG